MIIDLAEIATAAADKERENDHFSDFLKAQDAAVIDDLVTRLNRQIEPAIDCTACGNCCKTLMINVSADEALELSNFLNTPLDTVKAQYLEEGLNNHYVMKQMPCAFLEDTICSIYSNRFSGCRQFPNLEQKQFTSRLFTVFMHYGRCPIIFNVVEALKKETAFVFNIAS
jgi:uncharacterized protein